MLAEAGKKGEIEHPPLELLFTVDEETGFMGVRELEAGFCEGKLLLNMDSEDEGVFIIGCAGGQNLLIALPIEWEQFDCEKEDLFGFFKISVEGLVGGHSGVEIHRQRANGIRLLIRALVWLRNRIGAESIRLVQISGGSVHNAIPNFAEAFVGLDMRKTAMSEEIVSNLWKTFQAEYAKTDTNLVLNLTEVDGKTDFKKVGFCMALKKKFTFGRVFSAGTEEKLIELIQELPHGVYRMSDTIPGLVETSNNLASVRTVENEVKILLSQRSSITSKLAEITWGVEALAKIVGARIEYENYYPAWEPDLDSARKNNELKNTDHDHCIILDGRECRKYGREKRKHWDCHRKSKANLTNQKRFASQNTLLRVAVSVVARETSVSRRIRSESHTSPTVFAPTSNPGRDMGLEPQKHFFLNSRSIHQSHQGLVAGVLEGLAWSKAQGLVLPRRRWHANMIGPNDLDRGRQAFS